METLSLAAQAASTGGAGEAWSFWTLGPIAVFSALGLVVSRKAVHGAMFVAVVMLCLAGLYVAQDAPFLGIVQIVVYTGAIMMLFLFVIMLVGVGATDSRVETIRGQRAATVLAGLGFGSLLILVVGRSLLPEPAGLADATPDGNIPGIADLIFTRYVFAFEITGALLITAALGAMLLAHRERVKPKPTQRELSEARFKRSGAEMGPLPGSGVYARHDSIATPALLPDGTPSDLSVSRVLEARGALRPADRVKGDVSRTEQEVQELTTGGEEE